MKVSENFSCSACGTHRRPNSDSSFFQLKSSKLQLCFCVWSDRWMDSRTVGDLENILILIILIKIIFTYLLFMLMQIFLLRSSRFFLGGVYICMWMWFVSEESQMTNAIMLEIHGINGYANINVIIICSFMESMMLLLLATKSSGGNFIV